MFLLTGVDKKYYFYKNAHYMKKSFTVTTIIALFSLGLFLTACRKSNSPELRKSEKIEIRFDQKKFDYEEAALILYTKGEYFENDMIRVNAGKGLMSQGIPNEYFFLTFNYPNSVGSQPIIESGKWSVIGGDAIYNSFELDDTYNNRLTISSFDKNKKIMEGDFNIRLKRSAFYQDNITKIIVTGNFNTPYKINITPAN